MNQENLFETENEKKDSGPVNCLGMTFESDEARRAHFTELLREKLQDPEFRKNDGFPLGDDETILKLSNPPYYTVCPNPWLNSFINEWESKKEHSDEVYSCEPFAADVSEGKSGSFYTAHSYHTKVPFQAIMRYILHYTKPGDIVLDSFSGSGMTGVAALMCGERSFVEQLGLSIINNDIINDEGKKISEVGSRHSIISDLSPVASFIGNNYNNPVSPSSFQSTIEDLLSKVDDLCGWMYKTLSPQGLESTINYTVYSDVFSCNACEAEIVFYEHAIEHETGRVKPTFTCPNCSVELKKQKLNRLYISKFDQHLNRSVKLAKQVPVLINYSIEGEKGSENKSLDQADFELIEKIERIAKPRNFPLVKIPDGNNTRQPMQSHGLTHLHHFYTDRALMTLSVAYDLIDNYNIDVRNYLRFTVEQAVLGMSKLARYVPTHFSQVNQYLSGTLYIGSQVVDVSLKYILDGKSKRLVNKLSQYGSTEKKVVQVGDASSLAIKESSIDYIFIDPPFGANLNYSELNFLWESWLGVVTNNKKEAIENSSQGKELSDYRNLMVGCFREAYRVLKPGRWITVEFSNTKASVWNSIQSALSESGFIVGNVSALDKKQGSFKSVTTTTAVKQDLVISAYKPSDDVVENMIQVDNTQNIWSFVSSHLLKLPVVKYVGNELAHIPERDPRILFDQLVAFYVRKGLSVPLSSQSFQVGLSENFSCRDSMYFVSEQVAEYERARALSSQVKQLSIFVDDEASAIEWMRQELKSKPKTYSEIHPLFLNELSGWKKNELALELSTLLEQNFLKYDGKDDVPSQIHTYLSTNFKDMRGLDKSDPKLVAKAKDRWYVPDPNKAADLEKVRFRALLKEFETYKAEKKKIKQPRAEALRAGFNAAWESEDFQTILDIAKKIPTDVLQEDEKLLMFYDNALTLTSTEDDEW